MTTIRLVALALFALAGTGTGTARAAEPIANKLVLTKNDPFVRAVDNTLSNVLTELAAMTDEFAALVSNAVRFVPDEINISYVATNEIGALTNRGAIAYGTNWWDRNLHASARATNGIGLSVDASSIDEIRLGAGGRMTRLVEAVCIVTNVTHWNNESGCSTCDMLERAARSGSIPAIYHPSHGAGPYTPATKKTETTEVMEVKTLRFVWDNQEHVINHTRVLSRKVKRWARKDNWVEE